MARRVTTTHKTVATIAAWLVALILFFPILYAIITSLKTEGEAAVVVALGRAVMRIGGEGHDCAPRVGRTIDGSGEGSAESRLVAIHTTRSFSRSRGKVAPKATEGGAAGVEQSHAWCKLHPSPTADAVPPLPQASQE